LGVVIAANCGMYAILWQYILKIFDVNVAYSHSAVYNIWSLVWAWLIFSERINPGNLVGTVLIIAGIWVIRNE
jgi:drug/metabolite transporter (DMT)-like permease